MHAGAGASLEKILHAVEEFLVDERFVPPFVELAVIEDPAGVVGVAEHALDGVAGDRTRGQMATGRTGLEALVLHDGRELRDAVLPRGVELEHEPYQRSAFLIDADAVHQVPLNGDASVEVPDWGAGDRATVLGLVGHLELHVLPVEPVLEFVHGVSDRRHRVTLEAVAEVLLRRDELDAEHA